MIRREIDYFLHALMFYTRTPVTGVEYKAESLNKSFRYFPLIGLLIGALGGSITFLLSYVLPQELALVLGLAFFPLFTGAFHEDGLSDFFDGFGAGRTKERILSIMKDSSIGAYGIIALIFLHLFKFVALYPYSPIIWLYLFMASHASSRLLSTFYIRSSKYVRKEEEHGKAEHTRNTLTPITLLIASIFGLIPLFLISWKFALLVIALDVAFALLLRSYTERKIGGFTGDVLGAVQQIGELMVYLSFAIATSFVWV
ncbi:MAG: adenosylcobinamide-GDP ribazoletransferase [Porphyromonas sp.]|nr:adenosylcobinamide-GDP ribazoletransferase [Porphyromonas sp.]